MNVFHPQSQIHQQNLPVEDVGDVEDGAEVDQVETADSSLGKEAADIRWMQRCWKRI